VSCYTIKFGGLSPFRGPVAPDAHQEIVAHAGVYVLTGDSKDAAADSGGFAPPSLGIKIRR
jgi:hypothetical protein